MPEVAIIMKQLYDVFPELRRPMKQAGRSRVLHDIIAQGVGLAVNNARPTLDQSVAQVMSAGYHVTTQPVNVIPMRRRVPGTETMPSADAQIGVVKEHTQRGQLLLAYLAAGSEGLTDEEARVSAAIPERSCWWKRCGELRAAGLISPLRDEHETLITRVGTAGTSRVVCTITLEGRAVASSFE